MGIIIKPIVTEKQTAITEKFPNRYGFRVSPDANKLEIKKAVEDMYSVTVVDVNTINYCNTVHILYSFLNLQFVGIRRNKIGRAHV